MARIETYPLDGNISVNDFVIGSDGDSLNATKNYKLLTILDYLGRLYNLNSTDLLFNYNNVASGAVGSGEVSTNNFADGTILMSGVTNIYVSKLTAFGQLVDDILNTIGTNNLSIMFADMGNRNNLGIFTVDSAVDVDANTINLTVTGTTTNGSIAAGKVMGIRIGVGGGSVDLSGYVTLATDQTITGTKIFNAFLRVNANLTADKIGLRNTDTGEITEETTVNTIAFNNVYGFVFNPDGTSQPFGLLSNHTAIRTHTLQDEDGTIAHLSDIPTISDIAYDATSWNNNSDGASKNAIRDKIETIVPYYNRSDFKKTIVNGTGTGSSGGFSVGGGSTTALDRPIQMKLLLEGQGADLSQLIITIQAGTSALPSEDFIIPALPVSTATQPILIEASVDFDNGSGTAMIIGKVTTNDVTIPFFTNLTSVSGTPFGITIQNPTASGGNVRQEWYYYWQ